MMVGPKVAIAVINVPPKRISADPGHYGLKVFLVFSEPV